MSLTLLQGYSSGEEEEEEVEEEDEGGRRSQDEENGDGSSSPTDEDGGGASRKKKRPTDLPKPSPNSLLPSALDVFAEISGPPEFLNNSVEAAGEQGDLQREFGRRGRNRGGKQAREKKDLPAGVVVEAKAQLVGIRDRVRSDVDSGSAATPGAGKRVASAANPEPEDAAELLRMCLQCGIPKTYSHSRGMVCPVCGDRPPPDPNSVPEKKKGSMVKDKERSKRMKGQSSHSTWKSETEMHLRQQFD